MWMEAKIFEVHKCCLLRSGLDQTSEAVLAETNYSESYRNFGCHVEVLEPVLS